MKFHRNLNEIFNKILQLKNFHVQKGEWERNKEKRCTKYKREKKAKINNNNKVIERKITKQRKIDNNTKKCVHFPRIEKPKQTQKS